MTKPATLLLLPFVVLAAPACGGGNSGGSGGSGGGGGGGAAGNSCSGNNLVASEANDYSFTSTLTFPPIKVAPKSDLTFDWSAVSKDFLGHTLDTKKELNTILVLMWKLTLDDLQVKLNADALKQKDLVTLPLQYSTDGSATTAKMLAFTNTGAPSADTILSFLDPSPSAYPPAQYTYTLMAATGNVLGEGTKMIQSFQVDPNSTNTKVSLTTDSTQLTYTANLHNLTPTGVPAGEKSLTLEYGNLSKNALGNEWVASNITKALIGHYTQTPSELEEKFLDLELIATKLYRGEIKDGTKAILSNLKTDSGESFPGIDNTGTWVVALQCGGCRNPAPWYLSILKTCTP
jgi:hypothetical protein